jgi:uncharacterized membrane protein
MQKKILTITIIFVILIGMLPLLTSFCSARTAEPTKMSLIFAPTKVTADNGVYDCIFIELLDSTGKPARASSYITITLASTLTTIGNVDSSITINPGEFYKVAKFYTTSTPGTTTISATTTDFATVQASITTTAPGGAPTKLAIFVAPKLLPADNVDYPAVIVQIQDSSSRPTKNTGEPIYINVASSESSIGFISPMLTIAQGNSQAVGFFTVSDVAGTTSITAQASGFTTSQATITTNKIDLSTMNVQVTAASYALLNGNKTDITAYVTEKGIPMTGATLKFTSDNGGTFTTPKAQTNPGYYKTTFTAPILQKTENVTITATASKTLYENGIGTTQITIGPSLLANKTGIIQIGVKDKDGLPVSNSVVSSVIQPNGMSTLFDLTNSTGYVSFKNLLVGSYTFRILKDGFIEMNQTINFKGTPMTLTVTLDDGGAIDSQTLMTVAVIIIVAVVIALAAGLYFIRMRRTAKVRKLQQLQKHLKDQQQL